MEECKKENEGRNWGLGREGGRVGGLTGPGCKVHYHSRDQERRGSPAGNPPTNVGSMKHHRRRPRHEQACTNDKSQVSYGERGCVKEDA